MPEVTGAPDFEQSLGDLQDHLPLWWRAQDPTSNLHAILSTIAGQIDQLAVLFEQPYLDQVLATASTEGLLRNFAFAWGVGNEQLPTVLPQMEAYIQARSQEDGSLLSLINTLTTLLATSANLTGGPVLTFPSVGNLANLIPDPSFAHDTVGGAPVAWATTGLQLTSGATATVVNTTAPPGATRSCKVVVTNDFEGVTVQISPPPGQSAFQAGASYILQVALQGNVGGEQVNLLLSDSATGSDFAFSTPVLTTGWQQFSLLWIPTANESHALVTVRAGSATPSTWFLGNAMVHPGNVPIPYGDGDTPGWTWSGTPGDSASTDQAAIGLVFPDPSGSNLVFPLGGGIPLPATFGSQPAGLPLYEFTPGNEPTIAVGLVFPADGSGLTFPGYPQSLPSDNVIAQDGTVPPGGGPGLVFSSNQLVQITPNFSAYTLTVQAQNWCQFDRGAFARAVDRFRPMDWYPTVIEETTNYH